MLAKKILGAKVLDTNGYVQATRLITPTNSEKETAEIKQLFNQGTSKPAHQLGDIYSANMIDVVARAVSQGDSQLESEVKAEKSERLAADTKLQNAINKEVSDRKKAITDLINGAPEAYDTLKEISDYIAEDKDAGAAMIRSIANEAEERKTADTAETDRAKSAEQALQAAIVEEATNRAQADSDLKAQIENIISTTKDQILAKAIVSLQSSTYDKATNTLTQIFVKGDDSTVTYVTDLSDILDTNDIKDSESTTVSATGNSVSVNTIGVDELNDLINKD